MTAVLSLSHKRGDDFSTGGAKIGVKQSRELNSKYNFMSFFQKGIYGVQWGLGQSPKKLGSFREFLC